MDIGAKFKELIQDIEAHFPGHPHVEPLATMADQWAGRDIAAEDRAVSPQVPVAESVDLGDAEAQVAADAKTDEDLLAAPTEPPLETPAPTPAPAPTP